MTSVPVPTFLEQDAWYNLTIGNINPSIADTVPTYASLQPDGDEDGVVGSLDGGLIFVAGEAAQLDGGQKWLMWVADSLTADDASTVFCPFVDTSTPGRWKETGATLQSTGLIVVNQTVTAGGTKEVTASTAQIINVFVSGRSEVGATTLNLPGSTFTGQEVRVKDQNGDANASNIVLTAAAIDAGTTLAINTDYGSAGAVWNGTGWNGQ